jgi:pimeloyl-ACP methyl ester carboxylesterase
VDFDRSVMEVVHGEAPGITVNRQGDPTKPPILLLHGGAGPRSMAGLANALTGPREPAAGLSDGLTGPREPVAGPADGLAGLREPVAGPGDGLAEGAYVLTPTHPGFEGTDRPEWMDTVADLATAYLDLLDHLGLNDVLVVGNSVGGWIAAEMALRDNHGRLRGLVLLNAVGTAGDIADLRTLTPPDIAALAFANPANAQQLQTPHQPANQQTLALYAGNPYMHDPKLHRRLARVTLPVLVLWGENDGVVTPTYGQALADAFPNATFQLVHQAGHFPQIEQQADVIDAIRKF